jgi:hypothetical protein
MCIMQGKPITKINIDLSEFAVSRQESGLTVLCGSNNSGKSYILKNLYEKTGYTSYYLAVQRFYNTNQFSTSNDNPNKRQEIYRNFIGNFQNNNQNDENNYLELNRIITDMSDNKRGTLFEICSILLNQHFTLVDITPGNRFSPGFIDVDGINMSFTSAGTRLLVTLIGTLIDDGYDTFYLDEPELGLTPKIQATVANFLYNQSNRRLYFPHLKNLFISTHSHIFLDRKNINNNFSVSNDHGLISIDQIPDMSSFHSLQFNLLGNTFESLFLPSAIIIVEGLTDYEYIKRSLNLLFPNNNLTVISANTDGEIIQEIIKLEKVLLDLSKSPYKDRIFIITDKKHSSPTLLSDIQKHKIPKEHIIEWDNNGIEFVYPIDVLKEIYNCSDKDASLLTIDENENIVINGVQKSKKELCQTVVEKLTKDTTYPSEFVQKLVETLRKSIN